MAEPGGTTSTGDAPVAGSPSKDSVESTPAAPSKSVREGGRPAETATAVTAGLAALAAQLFDVENATTVSVLLGLVGLVPAAVTWLVELGRHWDGTQAAEPRPGSVARELEFSEARLLRQARITGGPQELAQVKSIRAAFAETAGSPEGGPGAGEGEGSEQEESSTDVFDRLGLEVPTPAFTKALERERRQGPRSRQAALRVLEGGGPR